MESKKFFKVCYIASPIILVIFIIIVVILCFTIFKPKQPEIVATPVGLTNIKFTLTPNITLSLSLRTDVALRNPNYAGFKYKNSTTYVYYGGNLVGDAAIGEGVVAARSTKRIGTVVTIRADEVVGSAEFLTDVIMGSLNMTAKSNMEGKVILLGVFKLRARTITTCDVSVFIWKGNNTSTCKSKVKL